MLQKLDLTSIAEEIVSPYRPIPLASLAALEASLFICQGSRSWRREVSHDSLLMVLEGVITLDAPVGKTVVSEGELATVGKDVVHSTYSGMRSTVLLVEERRDEGRSNGHHAGAMRPGASPRKVNLAAEVRGSEPFTWSDSGKVGIYSAWLSRLVGSSASFAAAKGSMLVTVHRGVLDYSAPESEGTLVGGQMLVISPDIPIVFHSEHGATVLALARSGAPLPSLVGTTSRGSEAGSEGSASR